MLTPIIVAPQQKRGAVLAAAMWNGQWGYISGVDENGDIKITPVATSGNASVAADLLYPVQYIPRTNEEEELYQNPGSSSVAIPMPSGTRVVYYVGPAMFQDDTVINRHSSNTWSGGTVGAKVYLNTSGWPIVGTASGMGTTVVATFEAYNSGAVQYNKISYGG